MKVHLKQTNNNSSITQSINRAYAETVKKGKQINVPLFRPILMHGQNKWANERVSEKKK